jgi:hypothetical protein
LTFVQDVDRARRPLKYSWLAFLRSGIETSVSPSTSTAPLFVASMLMLLKNKSKEIENEISSLLIHGFTSCITGEPGAVPSCGAIVVSEERLPWY